VLPFSLEPNLSSCLLPKNLKIKTHKTIHNFTNCWNECVKLGLSCLGEKHRLMVFKNGVLMRILETKRQEVTRGWRKLHN